MASQSLDWDEGVEMGVRESEERASKGSRRRGLRWRGERAVTENS